MTRHTKIIATLGPATQSPEMIGALIDRGANVFRLNMSHGRHEWVREMVEIIRAQAEARGVHTAILMDLQGPSIRTGDLPEPVELAVGDEVEFRIEGTEPERAISTTVNYVDLPKDVRGRRQDRRGQRPAAHADRGKIRHPPALHGADGGHDGLAPAHQPARACASTCRP